MWHGGGWGWLVLMSPLVLPHGAGQGPVSHLTGRHTSPGHSAPRSPALLGRGEGGGQGGRERKAAGLPWSLGETSPQ